MCSTKSIQQVIKELEESPMFNLSLSSKELFHSNFLAWLGNNPKTKRFFVEVINDLVVGLNLQSSGSWTVEREDQHFDLCIKDDNDNYLLIIENKVKSIPLKRQLDEYVVKNVKGKDKDTIYLLLTLTEKFAHRTQIDKAIKTKGSSNNWIVKTYKDLASVMQGKQYLVTDTYLQSILKDYIRFIENLDTLVREWQNETKFAQDWDDIHRLKDIHAKIQFSRYCEKLKKEHLSKLTNIVVYDNDYIPETIDNSKVYVKVNWGFASKGQEGIFDIEIPVTCLDKPKIVTGLKTDSDGKVINPYSIEIQVQGRNYRHVIETHTSNLMGTALRDFGLKSPYTDYPGFDFFSDDPLKPNLHIPNYGNNSIFIKPTKQNKKKELYPVRTSITYWPFASYKDSFMYQSRYIEKSATINEVLENVLAEVKRILNSFPKVTTP